MRAIYTIFFCVFLSLGNYFCLAQTEFRFQKYDVRDGLLSNQITDIFQDNEGFIWVGTVNGINRFDGYLFKEYKLFQDDSSAPLTFDVQAIAEDKFSNLWIGTDIGLFVLNKRTHNVFSVLSVKEEEGLSNVYISDIEVDDQNRIWLSTWDALDLAVPDYSETGEVTKVSFRSFYHEKYTSDINHNYTLKQLSDGDIWIGLFTKGILIFDPEKEHFDSFREKFELGYEFKSRIADIIEDSIFVYMATWGNGLCIFNKETHKINNQVFGMRSTNELENIVLFNNEKMLIGTQGGLIDFNLKTKKYHVYKATGTEAGLSQNLVNKLLLDKQNGLWVGTIYNGLNYHHLGSKKFYSYNNSNFKDVLPYNTVNSFHQVGDEIWFCTGNGIGFFNEQSGKFNKPILQNQSPYSDVRKCFSLDNNTAVIFGGNSIFKYNRLTNQKKIIVSDKMLHSKLANAFIKNADDGYYVFTRDFHVFSMDEEANFLKQQVLDIESSKGSFLYSAMLDSTNTLWLFTNLGIIELISFSEKDTAQCEYNWKPFKNNQSIFVYEGARLDNYIWLATEIGLIRYNLITDEEKLYSRSEGLPTFRIFSVQPDTEKILWLGTACGLVRFNPSNELINVFYKNDGLQGNVYISRSSYKSASGQLYFGGESGFSRFFPEEIVFNNYPPEIVFTNFKISNNEVLPMENSILKFDINYAKKIKLKHSQSDITISWAALNYIQQEKNQFKYRLKGLNENWVIADRRHEVNYTNLRPGKYTFEVMGSNNDQVWNEIPKTIEIEIVPPFWMTWWFRIGVVLTILFIGSGINYMRIRRLKKTKELLEIQVKERTREIEAQKEELSVQADNLLEVNILLKERQDEIEAQSIRLEENNHELVKLNATKDKFFSIIAHDLKNPFQGIIGFSDILNKRFDSIDDDKKKTFIREIQNSSQSAFSLLENLLFWARTQTSNIDCKPLTFELHEVIDSNLKLLKLNAEQKQIVLINNIDRDLTVFADKNMITTVIRNLINNAIKFTPQNGKIEVSAITEGQHVSISVKDSGVGMAEHVIEKLFRIDQQVTTKGTSGEKGTGLGLIICKEFVEINKGTITVKSELEKGSEFIVWLPLGSDSEVLKIFEDNFEQEISKNAHKKSDERLESITGKIILVVEDNETIRSNIIETLSPNFDIHVAENGEKGWEKALEIVPDLIISDVMMPVMDGFELTSKIINDKRTCHIPLIILTAKVSERSKIKGLVSGAIDYLTKPYNPEELKLKVTNVLITREELIKRIQKSVDIDPKAIAITTHDEEFLQRILEYLEENIQKSDITVEVLCDEIGMTRTQLYRKLQTLTGMPVNEFVRAFRLKRAAQYLKDSDFSIKEIAYEVGFNDPDYFGRAFKKMFGTSPSDYK